MTRICSRLPELLCLLAVSMTAPTAAADTTDPLVGLWTAYKRSGPQIDGPLLIDAQRRRAQVGGFEVPVTGSDDDLRLRLPRDLGRFEGYHHSGELRGHWIQPAPVQVGQPMASPVVLRQGDADPRMGRDANWWQGTIQPRASEYRFYLPIRRSVDGLMTYLRNPDRNLGRFTNIQRIERRGAGLRFLGSGFGGGRQRLLASGAFDAEHDRFSLWLPPWRGGLYEFTRVTGPSAFQARPGDAGAWRYRAPPALDDGWQTADLDAVEIDLEPLRRLIENEIERPDSRLNSHRVHGLLIARRGRLVLEEYFHGFSRTTPHDTRSASKSVASMLVGAVMQAGVELSPDTPVYDLLRGAGTEPDARKQAMRLHHLLTMASGFYCDDNDSNAPGNENTLQEQTAQPDWYQYTLDLPMAGAPGDEAIYCSANSNLIGAMVASAAGQPLLRLFDRYLAEPLGVSRYYLGLQPTGEPYFGGGAHWLPRDFMKIGQLMLNGGTWNGRRVLSREWVQRSTREQVRIGDRAYGYQWWVNEYPHNGGTVRAFFAAGNGGQIVMGVPALDLLIAFFGGNYSDPVLMRAQNVLVPEYILPAVR